MSNDSAGSRSKWLRSFWRFVRRKFSTKIPNVWSLAAKTRFRRENRHWRELDPFWWSLRTEVLTIRSALSLVEAILHHARHYVVHLKLTLLFGLGWVKVNGYYGVTVSARILKVRCELFSDCVLASLEDYVWQTLVFQSGLHHLHLKIFRETGRISIIADWRCWFSILFYNRWLLTLRDFLCLSSAGSWMVQHVSENYVWLCFTLILVMSLFQWACHSSIGSCQALSTKNIIFLPAPPGTPSASWQ